MSIRTYYLNQKKQRGKKMKNKETETLRRLIKALSNNGALNSDRENKLLAQAKQELIKRRAW